MAKNAGPEAEIGILLKERGLTLAIAESCTGGLLSSMVTDVAGSSEYFMGSVVVYSNDAKKQLLGVKDETLKKYGAVSRPTATEMAQGIKERFGTRVGVSVTGIAGPGGGTPKKPVGTVFIGVSTPKKITVKKFLFKGTRKEIKKQSALQALEMLKSGILKIKPLDKEL
ncbi:MAG: CinA family protein [Deltaproteobacteria bacterium]|nr:CinA family protein [Deltaproteobacteria bacterium]